MTICNVENAAGGFGVTREMAKKIFTYGVDLETTGNHIWDREEIRDYLDTNPRMLRPANFPSGTPGSGMYVDKLPDGRLIATINLQGRVYMKPIDCPFKTADGELSILDKGTNIDIRRHSRRDDIRETGARLLSRRQSFGSDRYAHSYSNGG